MTVFRPPDDLVHLLSQIGQAQRVDVIGSPLTENARAALQVADYGYVLETGEMAMEGESSSLATDPRVAATYLGQGTAP